MIGAGSAVHRFGAPAALGLLAVATWWLIATWSGVPGTLLPTPAAVLARLVALVTSGDLVPYLLVTLTESLGGCLLGTAFALPLAVLIHRSRWVAAAVHPFLGATQAIPAIALAPLLVLWVGYGLAGVIVLCALMVFFPILIATVLGLGQIDHGIIDAARIDGAGGADLLWQIEAPLALPSVLAGLRNGFALSVTGAVVGEMVMGGRGLGSVLTVQRDAVDTAGMFATIAVLCVIAATLYSLIGYWETRSQIIASLRRST